LQLAARAGRWWAVGGLILAPASYQHERPAASLSLS
jgi:hypothetical protein